MTVHCVKDILCRNIFNPVHWHKCKQGQEPHSKKVSRARAILWEGRVTVHIPNPARNGLETIRETRKQCLLHAGAVGLNTACRLVVGRPRIAEKKPAGSVEKLLRVFKVIYV